MLLWIDGFDNYGTTVGYPSPSGVVARNYSTAPINNHLNVQTGRLSGYCLRFYNGEYSTAYLRPPALTTNATLVVGVAFKFGSIIVVDSRLICFVDEATTGIVMFATVGGEISIRNGRTGLTLGTTSGLGLQVSTWYYVEVKIVAGSSGSYTVKVGGNVVLTGSGDTRAVVGHDYNSSFALTNPYFSSLITYFDDLYCLDGSGTVNNDFLGNMRIVTIRPDAAGDSTQFTPDSGNNYARVNEAICGDDSNYVQDAVADEKDLYNYGALGGVLTSIAGIVVITDCRETDATSFNLKTVCKSGATESDDAGQVIGSINYVSRRRLMETDPNTASLPWTPTTLEAAQFGVKVA